MKKNYLLPILLLLSSILMSQPIANFSSTTNGVCNGTTILFTDQSSNATITEWLWDFGNGNTSTEQNPTQVYTSIGTYNVCLTVTDDQNQTDQFCEAITPTSTSVSSEETYEGCEGDGYFVVVNGIPYDESNPVGMEVLIASSYLGCDSIVNINLVFNTGFATVEEYNGCIGDGYSILVNWVTYDESNPIGVESLVSMSGCDSIVTVNLIYNQTLTGTENYAGCSGDGYNVIVNGVIYNEANFIGTEILTSSGGCDSIVAVNLNFNWTFTSSEEYHGCTGDGYSVLVNGVTYDESNTSGTETLVSTFGCDSIVIINLVFEDVLTVSENYTGCSGDGYSVVINGTTYSEINPTGVETLIASGGCDSIITINLIFLSETFSEEIFTLCQGASIIIDGQLFNEANPSGTIITVSSNGCDSIIIVDLTFDLVSTEVISYNGCINDGYSVVVGGITYDENNPSGTEILTTPNGCDSIVTIDLNFGFIMSELYNGCSGNGYSITVNNTLYDESNPTGTESLISALGCDSIITINLIFNNIVLDGTVTDITCASLIDGNIEVMASGGTAPYTFDWSNGANTQSLTNLPAGTYTVTVTDDFGCMDFQDYIIVDPIPLSLSVNSTPFACEAEGMIALTPAGGIAPYTYDWSNGETTQNLENLIAGSYSVEVTDANGCTASEEILIEGAFEIEVTSTLTGCNLSDGTATASIVGGAPGNYVWSNGGITAEQTDLAQGWYSVTVSDPSSNCQVHQNIEVQEDPICFVKITGHVYDDDITPDCVLDGSTIGAQFATVELSDGQITFTNADGYYEFTVEDTGTYGLSVSFNTDIYEGLCVAGLIVDAVTFGETYDGLDFYLNRTEEIDVELKIVKWNARPGFNQYIRICVMNEGGQAVDGTLAFTHPGIQEYDYSNPSADNYDEASHTLSWDYTNLQPNQIFVYTAYLYTPIGTPLGTPLTYYFNSEPLAGEITPWNNEVTCEMEVTGSYDPNDKQVEPAGIGSEGIISMTDSILSYRIRFQNTGTDTAFTVLIRDTLDSDLDLQTIDPGPSSHPYTATLADENVLELLFENILLPDSFVNEPASNGFVMFDINIKAGSGYGTQIDNSAGIYFDFNPPIITNTVTNLIEMIISTEDLKNDISLEVHPNPAGDFCVINYQLPISSKVQIDVLDVHGRLIKTALDSKDQQSGEHIENLNLNGLQNGVYFLSLKTDSGHMGTVEILKME